MNDRTVTGLIHQTRCADLNADRQERIDRITISIIESNIECTHVSDFIRNLTFDCFSIILRVHLDDFHHRAFGEGILAVVDNDSCAVLDRRLKLTGRQINDCWFF